MNTCISDFRKKRKYDYVLLEQQRDILEDCGRNELLKEMYSFSKRLNKVDRMFILLWLDENTHTRNTFRFSLYTNTKNQYICNDES